MTLFHKALFSLLFIVSTPSFARITLGSPADVAVDGDTFQLKTEELKKFLEDGYRRSVENIVVSMSFKIILPDISPFKSGFYSETRRVVEFTIRHESVAYVISCSLTIDESYDLISTQNCTSVPEARVDHIYGKKLSQYTKILKSEPPHFDFKSK